MAGGEYPASIVALHRGGDFFVVASADVQNAALKRISDVCCDVLVQSQRDSLVTWIKFLLDPVSLRAAKTKDDELTVKLMLSDFTPVKFFLKRVLAIAGKACPKKT